MMATEASLPAASTDSEVAKREVAIKAPDSDDVESAAFAPRGAGTTASSYGGVVELTQGNHKSTEERDKLLHAAADGRYPYLDIVRILCVCLVCVDHGGTAFGQWNTMYVQAWVLQYLFLISGICFGMSSKRLPGFVARLALYFCVGVSCNFTAWIILGLDWRHDAWNVVFQFWFVVALVLFTLLLAPLKAHLSSTKAHLQAEADADIVRSPLFGMGRAAALVALAGGYFVLSAIFNGVLVPLLQHFFADSLSSAVNGSLGPAALFWGLPATPEAARGFLSDICGYFQLSLSNMYIVLASPVLTTEVSSIGWLAIMNTYAHKMVFYRAQEARLITGFDCMMLGLVCYYYGLKHRRVVGEYLVRYWFVLLFVCALLWPPGSVGRFDENPPTDLPSRARDNLLEGVFVVLFLTAAERMIDPGIFLRDRMEFLNDWALVLFMVHKAVHLMFPEPFNWAVLLLLAIPSYFIRTQLGSGGKVPKK